MYIRKSDILSSIEDDIKCCKDALTSDIFSYRVVRVLTTCYDDLNSLLRDIAIASEEYDMFLNSVYVEELFVKYRALILRHLYTIKYLYRFCDENFNFIPDYDYLLSICEYADEV